MWFSSKRKTEPTDIIWFTKAEKLAGTVATVREALTAGRLVLVLTHFEATLAEVRDAFDTSGITYRIADHSLDPGCVRSTWFGETSIRVILGLTERIGRYDEPAPRRWRTEDLEIVVTEHYPIPDRDDTVMAFADACGIDGAVRFHCCLEDPLFREFGSERYAEVLKTLSKGSAEPITGKAITKAIRSAQQKVQARTPGDQRVASAEEWFDYNLRRGLSGP